MPAPHGHGDENQDDGDQDGRGRSHSVAAYAIAASQTGKPVDTTILADFNRLVSPTPAITLCTRENQRTSFSKVRFRPREHVRALAPEREIGILISRGRAGDPRGSARFRQDQLLRERFAATHAHVSKDLLRNRRDKQARQLALIDEALSTGRSVVVDNVNATRADRAALIAAGRRHGASVRCYVLDDGRRANACVVIGRAPAASGSRTSPFARQPSASNARRPTRASTTCGRCARRRAASRSPRKRPATPSFCSRRPRRVASGVRCCSMSAPARSSRCGSGPNRRRAARRGVQLSQLALLPREARLCAGLRPPAGGTLRRLRHHARRRAPRPGRAGDDRAAPPLRRRAIKLGEPRYLEPLLRDARALRLLGGDRCRIVLLGSIASERYVEPLLEVFGERLLFPPAFVGRGDMSRGGLLLRCVDQQRELEYAPVAGAVRHGPRPPRLGARRARGTPSRTRQPADRRLAR